MLACSNLTNLRPPPVKVPDAQATIRVFQIVGGALGLDRFGALPLWPGTPTRLVAGLPTHAAVPPHSGCGPVS